MKKTVGFRIGQDVIALSLHFKEWGNSATGDKSKIKTEADKELLKLQKILIDPKGELRAIQKFNGSVKFWVQSNTVPSVIQRGLYLVRREKAEEIDDRLEAFSTDLQPYIDSLIAVYADKVNEARERLDNQFNQKNYPSEDELRAKFSFTWDWIRFDVADGLTEKLRLKQVQKLQEKWDAAATEITMALRESFRDLIKYATDALTTKDNGKVRGFKNTTFENITKFIDTFKGRNVTNDEDLEPLIEQAKAILSGVQDPQDLKKDASTRIFIKRQFKQITKELDEMIIEKPSRKFDLDD